MQLGVVHLQRPAHGLALLVRRGGLRATTRAALPNPRPRASLDVGRRTTDRIDDPIQGELITQ
jgi:hypothetical protein